MILPKVPPEKKTVKYMIKKENNRYQKEGCTVLVGDLGEYVERGNPHEGIGQNLNIP